MKVHDFERKVIAARPAGYAANTAFADAVMAKIRGGEIFTPAIRNMNVTNKETFIMKLKHLPKFAVVAIAIGLFALLTGTTYAVVKTIENLNNVKVNEATTNEAGRQQLNVTLENCDAAQKEGVKYELKRGGNLSADDGARTLQARCDMDTIDTWFRNNYPADVPSPFLYDQADIIIAIDKDSVTLKQDGKKTFTKDAQVIAGGKQIPKDDLKVGDTVFSYPDAASHDRPQTGSQSLGIFLVTQPTKYYSGDLQSYVNERGPCPGNPQRECLHASNINHTILTVAKGGAYYTGGVALDYKEIQGKVVSYDASGIKLDVGGGVIYTLETPSNIVERYNTVDVHGLAKLDNIYAHTVADDLKIRTGDSLDIFYLGEASESSSTIAWSRVTTVLLMVERIPNNLEVLRKY